MVYNFDVDVAKEYGVDEAIMIANLQFWIAKNKANKKHEYDGRTWTYNSVSAFSELFPFWTPKQIRRIIDKLKNNGVIMVGNYNSVAYDRTLWYAFVDEKKWLFQQKGKNDFSERELPFDQKGNPIPDNKPDNNKNAKAFLYMGEFKNVKLTKEEFVKLVKKYGWYFEDGIEVLSAYIAAKGDKYKDHYAVMKEKNWVWEKVHKDSECGLGVCEYVDDENGESRLKTPLEYYAEMYKVEL